MHHDCKTTHCIACSGASGIHVGPPSKKIIKLIQSICIIDCKEAKQGDSVYPLYHRKYFRNSKGNLVRLNTPEAFAELNALLDSQR